MLFLGSGKKEQFAGTQGHGVSLLILPQVGCLWFACEIGLLAILIRCLSSKHDFEEDFCLDDECACSSWHYFWTERESR